VKEASALLDVAKNVSPGHLRSRFDRGIEYVACRRIEGRRCYPVLYEVTGLLRYSKERASNTVQNRAEEAGTELDAEAPARRFHRLSNAKAGCLLVNLHGCPVPFDTDYLAHEAVPSNPGQLIKADIGQWACLDQRSGDSDDARSAHRSLTR
jgi:hypothetical protein